MSHCEAFFREADQDGSGELSYCELAKMLRSKGYKAGEGELKKLFETADNTGDSKISLQEFMVVMGEAPPEEHKKAQLRSLCRSFDTDGSGEIDAAELKAAIGNSSQCTQEDIERLIKTADADGSGTWNYEEFLNKVIL